LKGDDLDDPLDPVGRQDLDHLVPDVEVESAVEQRAELLRQEVLVALRHFILGQYYKTFYGGNYATSGVILCDFD